MTEEWRDVAGFEGLYQISSLGRVRSLSRPIRTAFGSTKMHYGRVRSPAPNADGYLRVVFRVDGAASTQSVHRLVCRAFHGEPGPLRREVDHIDGNRANCRADNLRWVSRAENMSNRRGWARGEQISQARLTEDAVREIRQTNGRHSVRMLADKFGVNVLAIYDVKHGRTWAHVA